MWVTPETLKRWTDILTQGKVIVWDTVALFGLPNNG